MIRVMVLLVVGAAAFSFFAFKQGGYLPGTILALCAILLVGLSVWSIRRRGGSAGGVGKVSVAARRVTAVISVVVLAGVAYSVYWLFWIPKPATLKGTYSFRKVCESMPKYFSDAAAFSGPAPHPIVVFAALDSVGLDQVDLEYGAPPQWRPRDATAVQLVACLDDVKAGQFITDCKFTRGSVPLYQGKFTGTVFEARTGKKVGSVSVDGVTGPKCPYAATTKGDNPRLFSAPDLPGLMSALGDKVDR